MSAATTTDVFTTFPDLAWARDALKNRDWSSVEAYFDRMTSWDDRVFALYALTSHAPDGYLAERAEAESRARSWTSLARTMRGWQLIGEGWEVRSSNLAKNVSRDQFDTFHAFLRRAERILIEATAADPWNVCAWVSRMTAARGLGLGTAESRRRLAQSEKSDPGCVEAMAVHQEQLYGKWGGSDELVLTFVRERTAALPPGSRAGVLVAKAHIEVSVWNDEHNHLGDMRVQQDILDAGAKSVLNPAYQARYHWIDDHGIFALALSLAGRHREAAVHFQTLGDHFPEQAYSRMNDPAGAFAKHRSRALAEG